jgi:hypothetical protein
MPEGVYPGTIRYAEITEQGKFLPHYVEKYDDD